jgi:hypothetical protein
MCGTWLSSAELFRNELGASMLLVEIAEPLLGRRKSAVLMPPLGILLGPVGLGLLAAAVLQRN